MNKEQKEFKQPTCTQKSICVAFGSESEYKEVVADRLKYRSHLEHELSQYPELFPKGMPSGFTLHDMRESSKQPGLVLRRIKISESQEVYTVRPSFVMPYLIAKTDAVEKALYLRQWGFDVSSAERCPFLGVGLCFWALVSRLAALGAHPEGSRSGWQHSKTGEKYARTSAG